MCRRFCSELPVRHRRDLQHIQQITQLPRQQQSRPHLELHSRPIIRVQPTRPLPKDQPLPPLLRNDPQRLPLLTTASHVRKIRPKKLRFHTSFVQLPGVKRGPIKGDEVEKEGKRRVLLDYEAKSE